jgi:signal peptidase I
MADEQIQHPPQTPTPPVPAANGEPVNGPVVPGPVTPPRPQTTPSPAPAPTRALLAALWQSWGWLLVVAVGLALVCVLVLRWLGAGTQQVAILAPLVGLIGAAWISAYLQKRPTPAGSASPRAEPAGQSGGWLKRILGSPTQGHAHQTESMREVVETVVFVVVLVLLLKSFAAEAFVIPTGSMAETLWGYQKWVVCPRCGYGFPVNASSQVEQQDDKPLVPVVGCICPNCRKQIDCERDQPNSGDRVLVAKSLWETGLMTPQRHDVVVFKYPVEPEKKHVPMNYIKRLIGLGGETIGIYYGKLYVAHGPAYPDDVKAEPLGPLGLWQKQYMHQDDFSHALDRLGQVPTGAPEFHIIRKSPSKIDALKRIVYDNDHPPEGIDEKRWVSRDGGWKADGANGFRYEGHGTGVTAWVDYRHLLPGHQKPELITDFMGYNTGEPHANRLPEPNWAGDLILDVEVSVEETGADSELALELVKGVDRFEARWNLATGFCTLSRLHDGGHKDPLGPSQQTALKGKGTHRVRFANVDERLTVWVDGSLPFGDGVAYEAPATRGPTRDDLQPVKIGVRSATANIHHLKLWRDTYYTLDPQAGADAQVSDWGDPAAWEPLRSLHARTLYVQPGHYLCLGDNSPESSDGRQWGTVPERLMLGRALAVYYPFYFPFPPLNTPVNRVGTIK